MTRKSRNAAAFANPTTVRLSKHFLLSDFMGCHSVYAHGYANEFYGEGKLEEGAYLCEQVLEPIVEDTPLSVSYGYISLELARRIVRYQSPEKPSYHQWNDGAACDIIAHIPDSKDIPPVYVARACDEAFPMSRTISYSESPYVCLATKQREGRRSRKAFYENRYQGTPGVKPLFLTVPEDRERFFKLREHWEQKHPEIDWRGAGYPTHHGGGRKQFHHYRTSKYTMLSDFLYSEVAVRDGIKNCPTITEAVLARFSAVGRMYDSLITALKINRLSIVRAYESPIWSSVVSRRWAKDYQIDFIPPEGTNPDTVAEAARRCHSVKIVSVVGRRVSVYGVF